jgi:hypothetical protein
VGSAWAAAMLMPPSNTATASKLVMTFIGVSFELRCCVVVEAGVASAHEDREPAGFIPNRRSRIFPENEKQREAINFPLKDQSADHVTFK